MRWLYYYRALGVADVTTCVYRVGKQESALHQKYISGFAPIQTKDTLAIPEYSTMLSSADRSRLWYSMELLLIDLT